MNARSFLSATALALATAITLTACSSDDSSDNNNNAGGGGNSSSGGTSGNIESVAIGTQVWMKKNLDVEVAGSKCYDDLPANCETYGRLYTWDMAKTACPNGWKLPSLEEWEILFEYAGGSSTAGKHLKATTSWNDYEGASGNGDNSSGFTALAGGYYDCNNNGCSFASIGTNGRWWTSHESSNGKPVSINLRHHKDDVGGSTADSLEELMSVRCIKD